MISDEPRIGQAAVLALDDQACHQRDPKDHRQPFPAFTHGSPLFRVHTRLLRSLGIEVDHRVRLQLNGQIGAVLSLVNGQIGVVLEGHGNLHDEAVVDDPFRLAGRVSLAAGAGQIQHYHAGVFPVGGQPPFACIDLLRYDEVTLIPPCKGGRAPVVLLTAVGVQLQSGQSGLIRMTIPRPYLLRQLGAGGTRPADVAAEAVVPLLRVKGEVVGQPPFVLGVVGQRHYSGDGIPAQGIGVTVGQEQLRGIGGDSPQIVGDEQQDRVAALAAVEHLKGLVRQEGLCLKIEV